MTTDQQEGVSGGSQATAPPPDRSASEKGSPERRGRWLREEARAIGPIQRTQSSPPLCGDPHREQRYDNRDTSYYHQRSPLCHQERPYDRQGYSADRYGLPQAQRLHDERVREEV